MSQTISVALLPSMLPPDVDWDSTCAVVLDVLRATSVMTTACRNGARRIVTCSETEVAFQMADQMTTRPLLCGERECRPIAGFDLGNSPAEYGSDTVEGRDLVITTTNGTRAIQSVMASKRLWVASFLNAAATLAALQSLADINVLIVCAGTNGQISYEDVLLAGALVEELTTSDSDKCFDDSARIARDTWRQSGAADTWDPDAITRALRRSLGGRNLISVGYEADLERCAQVNTVNGRIERTSDRTPTFGYRSGTESMKKDSEFD